MIFKSIIIFIYDVFFFNHFIANGPPKANQWTMMVIIKLSTIGSSSKNGSWNGPPYLLFTLW